MHAHHLKYFLLQYYYFFLLIFSFFTADLEVFGIRQRLDQFTQMKTLGEIFIKCPLGEF